MFQHNKRLTQNGEEDVDEEVGAATTLEEDTHGREDDGKDDLADVAESIVSTCRDAFVFCASILNSSRSPSRDSSRQP